MVCPQKGKLFWLQYNLSLTRKNIILTLRYVLTQQNFTLARTSQLAPHSSDRFHHCNNKQLRGRSVLENRSHSLSVLGN